MSADNPDITDPADVAMLAFDASDGVVQGDLTWESHVVVGEEGEIFVDVYPDRNPMGETGHPGFRYQVVHVGAPPEPLRP
ncbi:hypothetical protein [Amycolatopsis regifaucium]|uniref:Uncharacterized protein n=1 Tax=Amycolatopsis regifaucium TaxID=546365 RepID=A0A154M709_9PSEU|nr:hypothetical protein [Amycolatopsis regifaucium]KZB79639.1 hypothetical protein AVL48_14585 [Amycolatopsis regifaucium]OKA10044.1 hypothetical protein ATP06_0206830 [Amycolatopsis regifaucium]SFI63708.1 hypothetical protein SAMN04489731_11222 [Amycolatopsis regifaucium]